MYRFDGQTTPENSRERRLAAMEEALRAPNDTLAQRITNRLIIAWGEWQPDYEGWLKWSADLYSENAVINAIDGEKRFRDYQASMRFQRDACSMAMGPIEQSVVDGDTIALVYHMYLTPKNPGTQTADMLVTEFNKVEEENGRLKVTRLDLYTDGGSLR